MAYVVNDPESVENAVAAVRAAMHVTDQAYLAAAVTTARSDLREQTERLAARLGRTA